jgi:hypothetical protein
MLFFWKVAASLPGVLLVNAERPGSDLTDVLGKSKDFESALMNAAAAEE